MGSVSVRKGANYAVTYDLNNSDGTPLDLTGKRVLFDVSPYPPGSARCLRKDSAVGVAEIDFTGGDRTLGTGSIYLLPTDYGAGKLDPDSNGGTYFYTVWVDGATDVVPDQGVIFVEKTTGGP